MKRFGNNLRRERKRAGKTQKWMADQLHIHRTTYTRYETGEVEPSLDMFYMITKILEVNPMDLLE